jgi:hypothetical protein
VRKMERTAFLRPLILSWKFLEIVLGGPEHPSVTFSMAAKELPFISDLEILVTTKFGVKDVRKEAGPKAD